MVTLTMFQFSSRFSFIEVVCLIIGNDEECVGYRVAGWAPGRWASRLDTTGLSVEQGYSGSSEG